MTHSEPRAALFLDRDGVINEEINYLHRPQDLVLIPGSAVAIAQFNRLEIPVVLITNQAGIGRGIYNEDAYHKVQARLGDELRANQAHLDGAYFCPHHPLHGLGNYRTACACRKPNPGMLLAAAQAIGLDLGRSVMVGDKSSDLEAGRNAGCFTVLVRTGYGAQVEQALLREQRTFLYDGVFDSLSAATAFLLARFSCQEPT